MQEDQMVEGEKGPIGLPGAPVEDTNPQDVSDALTNSDQFIQAIKEGTCKIRIVINLILL
ncbi:MAG: hypothetical protein PV340_05025 [Wolbachia sp.]|nr:hypothetical protein [Wolbachia sp.]